MAVIGGGIAGLGLAWELARAGADVALFEAGRIGAQGASSLPAALLNPYRGRSGRATELDLAGLDAFWRLDDELAALGLASGARRSGVLRIPSQPRQAGAWRRLGDGDPELAWLEPAAVPPPFHAPHGALLVRRGGWVEAPVLLRALATAAQRAGAELHEGVRVRRLERSTRGTRLDDPVGRHFDEVVLCVGADPAPELPLPLLERVAGDIVRLGGDPLPYPVAGAVYGVSSGGEVLIGGNHRPAGSDDPRAPELLRRSFAWFAPPLAAAPIGGSWTGVRARRSGNRPLARQIGPGLWLLGALAGRGFLCGPLLARRLARELLGNSGIGETGGD